MERKKELLLSWTDAEGTADGSCKTPNHVGTDAKMEGHTAERAETVVSNVLAILVPDHLDDVVHDPPVEVLSSKERVILRAATELKAFFLTDVP
jgi:hypothetical protein